MEIFEARKIFPRLATPNVASATAATSPSPTSAANGDSISPVSPRPSPSPISTTTENRSRRQSQRAGRRLPKRRLRPAGRGPPRRPRTEHPRDRRRIEVLGGPVPQSQEIAAGGRYLSGDDPIRCFAAGTARELTVRVRWPGGAVSEVPGVPADSIVEVTEPAPRTGRRGDRTRRTRRVGTGSFAEPPLREPHRHPGTSAFGGGLRRLRPATPAAPPVEPARSRSGSGRPRRRRRRRPGDRRRSRGKPQGSSATRAAANWCVGSPRPGRDRCRGTSPGSPTRRRSSRPGPRRPGSLRGRRRTGAGVVGLGSGPARTRGARHRRRIQPRHAGARRHRRRWRPRRLRGGQGGAGAVAGTRLLEVSPPGRRPLRARSGTQPGPRRVRTDPGRAVHRSRRRWRRGSGRGRRMGTDPGVAQEPATFVEATEAFGLSGYLGWWTSVAAGDFDGDGRMDLVAGNWAGTARCSDSSMSRYPRG